MRFAQPIQSALTASIDRFRQRKNPNDAQHPVGFFYRELFAPGTAMLQGSGGNHHRIDFRPLQAKGAQAFNDRRSEVALRRCEGSRPL